MKWESDCSSARSCALLLRRLGLLGPQRLQLRLGAAVELLHEARALLLVLQPRLVEREREAVRHVNAEFERSQQGNWRRLFPSSRSKEYERFLDPARQMHHLPFNV